MAHEFEPTTRIVHNNKRKSLNRRICFVIYIHVKHDFGTFTICILYMSTVSARLKQSVGQGKLVILMPTYVVVRIEKVSLSDLSWDFQMSEHSTNNVWRGSSLPYFLFFSARGGGSLAPQLSSALVCCGCVDFSRPVALACRRRRAVRRPPTSQLFTVCQNDSRGPKNSSVINLSVFVF